MAAKTEKVTFYNKNKEKLSGALTLPEGTTKACALFAHCFTGSKDTIIGARISRALAALGFAVFRFDFTGLGESEGNFSDTNFSSNLNDIIAANQYLEDNYEGPKLLIGHSLGGAAVLAIAHKITSAKALATIGSPCDVTHVKHLFSDHEEKILESGCATVTIGRKKFAIKKQFLSDLEKHNAKDYIEQLNKALLIFHSPLDDIVSIDEAAKIYKLAKHPKSFVSLDKADHLLTAKKDSEYVATVLAAWAHRYILLC